MSRVNRSSPEAPLWTRTVLWPHCRALRMPLCSYCPEARPTQSPNEAVHNLFRGKYEPHCNSKPCAEWCGRRSKKKRRADKMPVPAALFANWPKDLPSVIDATLPSSTMRSDRLRGSTSASTCYREDELNALLARVRRSDASVIDGFLRSGTAVLDSLEQVADYVRVNDVARRGTCTYTCGEAVPGTAESSDESS